MFAIRLALLSIVCTAVASVASGEEIARGRVYLDANRNGVLDAGETGVPGVCVSNGESVVQTDGDGGWSLPVEVGGAVFVIKPSGYQLPVSATQIPRHYYLHSPEGSPPLDAPGILPTGPLPASIDFALHEHPETAPFKALFFGDTQARGLREVNFITHDVVEECLGTDAAFGVSLGDIVADDPALYAEIGESIAQIGIPWYNVFGNHDNNGTATENKYSDDSFERFFGPSTYAFEYGQVVFIPLNNIYFAPDAKGYKAAFTDRQVAFVKNYLAQVPKEKLVVLMMHAPIVRCGNRDEMLALLADRPNTLTVAAHVHEQFHVFMDETMGWKGPEPHHLFVAATVCGSWWCGSFDERGIPHATMNDGAPNGYSILTFDGPKYSIAFKAASRPADYQMNIYVADDVAQSALASTEVLVNVFAGSKRSTVEMRVGPEGAWLPMAYTEVIDPECQRMYEQSPYLDLEKDGTKLDTIFGWKMDAPSKSRHMWKAMLPEGLSPGTYTITVRTTDMFGQTYEARRIFRVRAPEKMPAPGA